MKKSLYIFVFLGMLILNISHDAYAKGHGSYGTKKIKCDAKKIQADKVIMAEDKKQIQADRQALGEAKKSKDKDKIEQAKEKLKEDTQKYKKDKTDLARDIG